MEPQAEEPTILLPPEPYEQSEDEISRREESIRSLTNDNDTAAELGKFAIQQIIPFFRRKDLSYNTDLEIQEDESPSAYISRVKRSKSGDNKQTLLTIAEIASGKNDHRYSYALIKLFTYFRWNDLKLILRDSNMETLKENLKNEKCIEGFKSYLKAIELCNDDGLQTDIVSYRDYNVDINTLLAVVLELDLGKDGFWRNLIDKIIAFNKRS